MEHDATVSEVRRGCSAERRRVFEVRISGGYLMADDRLPQREPGQNGPVVGGEHMPVPHAEPQPVEEEGE